MAALTRLLPHKPFRLARTALALSASGCMQRHNKHGHRHAMPWARRQHLTSVASALDMLQGCQQTEDLNCAQEGHARGAQHRCAALLGEG